MSDNPQNGPGAARRSAFVGRTPVTVQMAAAQSGPGLPLFFARDITPAGLAMESTSELPSDTPLIEKAQVHLSFTLPFTREQLSVNGEVVWTRHQLINSLGE